MADVSFPHTLLARHAAVGVPAPDRMTPMADFPGIGWSRLTTKSLKRARPPGTVPDPSGWRR